MGRPEDLIPRIQARIDAGVQELTFNLLAPDPQQLDLFMREILVQRSGPGGRMWMRAWPSAPRAFPCDGTDVPKILPLPSLTWRLKMPDTSMAVVCAVDANGKDLGGHQAFRFAWSQFHPATKLWPF